MRSNPNTIPFMRRALFVFLLYCWLFSPPYAVGSIRIYGHFLLFPIVFTYIILNFGEFKLFCKRFSRELFLMIIIVLYSLVRGVSGGIIRLAFEDLLGLFPLFLFPFFFISYGGKIGIKVVENMVGYLLITVTLAVLSTILALSIPSVDSFIRESFIRYREGEVGYEMAFRGFGLGSQMTSHYSFVIGMMISIGLLFRSNSKWFILVIPFALVACLVNARTGVVIGIVGLIIYLIFSKHYIALFLCTIFGIILFMHIDQVLGLFLDEETVRWVSMFLEEVETNASGNVNEGTLGVLLNEMIVLPKWFDDWIVGRGINLIGGRTVDGLWYHSDVGFINQLWYGGVFYCTLLYWLLLYICFNLYKRRQRTLALLTFVFSFIINLKGSFFFGTTSFSVIMLLYYMIMSKVGSSKERSVIAYHS